MKVLKFGGSSVATPERIRNIADISIRSHKATPSLVVVSAFQGVTDQLIEISSTAARGEEKYKESFAALSSRHLQAIHELIPVQQQSSVIANVKVWLNDLEDILHGVYLVGEFSKRMLDYIMAFGERLSAYIISEHVKSLGFDAAFLDARDYIKTDDTYGAARVEFHATNSNLRKIHESKTLYIATGFIASTSNGDTITLGRGGSDYTAAIIGAALDSPVIEIWTDVDGVMTSDPRKVPKAFFIPSLSYEEMMELSHFGAKVIYPPTIQPALDKRIPVIIKNSFKPEFPGTTISDSAKHHDYAITGISSIEKIALLRVQGSGMVGVAGVSMRLFAALARHSINVILITQASSEHTICFAVEPVVADRAKRFIDEEFALEIAAQLVDPVIVESDLSIVSIVGENMRRTPGIAGRFFQALGRNGINIVAIAQGSSELNISVVIPRIDEIKALNAVHDQFFTTETKTINVFLVGTGLIGSTLLDQIAAQSKRLREELFLDLKIVGLLNRTKMLVSPHGLDLGSVKESLTAADASTPSDARTALFLSEIRKLNLPNSVFVDCTASDSVVEHYAEILNAAVSIVTPNKRAQTGTFEKYTEMKRLARSRNVELLYETSVGAGLPVINTLNDLLRSGDEIIKIEAVLSGTLSYIFNTFSADSRFSDVVKKAKELGYTEPDPRDDLSGLDVARKLLILARECGIDLELADVSVESLVPADAQRAASVDEFFTILAKHDGAFGDKIKSAAAQGNKLVYIASIANGKAQVALSQVGPEHPFVSLSGSDNIVSFTTKRYNARPLVVKGPGAGAEVTAAGVFADIIRIAN